MVNKLIQALIGGVIGLALLPVITGFADGLLGTETEPGPLYDTTAGSLVNIIPVLYVIILVAGLAAFVYSGSRN